MKMMKIIVIIAYKNLSIDIANQYFINRRPFANYLMITKIKKEVNRQNDN